MSSDERDLYDQLEGRMPPWTNESFAFSTDETNQPQQVPPLFSRKSSPEPSWMLTTKEPNIPTWCRIVVIVLGLLLFCGSSLIGGYYLGSHQAFRSKEVEVETTTSAPGISMVPTKAPSISNSSNVTSQYEDRYITNTPTATPNPKLTDSQKRYLEIEAVVRGISGASLDSPSSPQSRALNWIASLDSRKVDPSNLILPQRYALVTIFYSTNGDLSWTNTSKWLDSGDECDWYGVVCTDIGGGSLRLSQIKLDRNNVQGTLPPELWAFPHITNIELWMNKIGGPIPEIIGMLTKLKTLYLDDNMISGPIPSSIEDLVALQDLSLYNNNLQGPLPKEIGGLMSLRRLWLSQNKLSGEIPAQIQSMISLQAIYLDKNSFTGAIPAGIGNLKALEDVRMNENELTGILPAGMVDLVHLEILYISKNSLSGPVPEWIGSLSSLTDLRLSGNDLTGRIPTEIGLCSNLESLDVSSNNIRAAIPGQISKLDHLINMYLYDNAITGDIPSSIVEMDSIKNIRLEGNRLEGSVPEGLCMLGLSILSVDCNGADSGVTCSCCTSCL